MKRVGFLIQQVADMDNLREAFYNAQQGKSAKQEVISYRENLEKNLLKIQQQLLMGNVQVGKYQLFKIYDPKERVVCAATFEERILHHALINICSPYFERHFISTTCANRKEKGIYKALALAHIAMGKYKYVAKLDVRKYFDSINHTILKQLLRKLFKDKILLTVMDTIIDSYEVTDCRGVPIGNLTSQYFANYYLSGLDHYAKEKLKIPVYVRYMDDILFFENDKQMIKKQIENINIYVQQQLMLKLKSPQILPTTESVAFLGYRLQERSISLTTRSKRRFEKKYKIAEKLLTTNKWTETEYQIHIMPLFAFVKHGYTKKYRKRIIEKVSVVGD